LAFKSFDCERLWWRLSERAAIVYDTFHGKDVQLDGYSVMLTITNLKESDFNVIYRLHLSYGISQTVQYAVLLESLHFHIDSIWWAIIGKLFILQFTAPEQC
jgi:hypothetical protein